MLKNFTFILLSETCYIIFNLLFPHTSITVNGFNKKEFSDLLCLATSNSYYLFNKQLYQQIDGVTMGSSLGPTLANIFMCHFESILQPYSFQAYFLQALG